MGVRLPAFDFWPETWQRGYIEWLVLPEISGDTDKLLAHLEEVERLLKRNGLEPSDANLRAPAQKTRPDRGQMLIDDGRW